MGPDSAALGRRRAAPRLTHLRISGANEFVIAPLWDLLLAEPPKFPNLRALALQPTLKAYRSQAECLEAIKEGLHKNKFTCVSLQGQLRIRTERASLDAVIEPAVLASPDGALLRDWTERLTNEWTARAAGERGLWVSTESEKQL